MPRTAPRTSRRRVAALGVVVLAVFALAACSGSSGGSSGQAAGAATPTQTACPTPVATAAPGSEETVTSGGEERTYNVWLPTGYDGVKRVPVVLDFHGTGGNSVDYATTFSGLGAEAPKRGYLYVAPQATKGDATALRWRVPGTGQTPDDVQFTADLLKDIASKYCVDPNRYYASGFSSGAAFTTFLSCQLDAWGAVAPMAGVNLSAPCPTRPPVPMITFHGDKDLFANYTGLPGADNTTNPDAFYDADVQKTVDQFAARNGCQPGRVDTTPVATITKRTYNGCEADTVLYIVGGAGHTYTGGPKLPAAATENIGDQSQAIDAAKVLLDFFDAHPRVSAPVLVPATAAAAAPGGSPTAPVLATVTAVPGA